MGRNEIRLRRKMIHSGRIARHRNYGALLERHEHDQKIKRIIRLFIYFIAIAFLIVVIAMLVRWERRENIKHQPSSSISIQKETIPIYSMKKKL